MIILLCGPDTFRACRKLEEIKEEYRKSQKQGFNLVCFGSDDANFQDFRDAVRQMPMFKEKKLIVLTDVFSNGDFKEKFLKEKEIFLKSDDIIVFFEKEKILVKDPLFKLLSKTAKIQQFDFLEGARLRNWIKSEFEKYGAAISEKALNQLTNFVGSDLWRMRQEIKKLVNYINSGKGKQIEFEDIMVLVKPKIETDIFKTIDAIAEKRKSAALHLLHKHLSAGNSPLYLLTMINFQFRNLLVVKDLIEKNNPFHLILKKSGLNPFVVKKTYQQAQRFSFPELKKIYQKIFHIDLDIKTGRVDPEIALDLLIAEI